jgi:hypothetical protein
MISKVMNGYSQQRDTWHDGALALREEMRALDAAFFAAVRCVTNPIARCFDRARK